MSRTRDPAWRARDSTMVICGVGGLCWQNVQLESAAVVNYSDILIPFNRFLVLSPSDCVGVGREWWQLAAKPQMLAAFDNHIMKNASKGWQREIENVVHC